MPLKQKTKVTATDKPARVGLESGLASTAIPRPKFLRASEDTKKESAGAAAISQGKKRRDLRHQAEGMRQELQFPEDTEPDDEEGSEIEASSESLEKIGGNGGKRLSDIEKSLKEIQSFLYPMKDELSELIESKFEKLDKKFDRVFARLDNHDVEIKKLVNKTKKLEDETKELKDRMERSEHNVTAGVVEREQMQKKIDSLENFSRRNNIKMVGLKEGAEGEDLIAFLQKWIPENLGIFEEAPIEIERAHRVFRPSSNRAEKPRSILIRFLRYQDKEKILKTIVQRVKDKKGPLMIKGKPVFFYPDISYDLLKKRKEFNPAKKLLWEKSYKFILSHPATLIIFLEEDVRKSFKDPDEAEEFANSLPSKE